MSRSASLVSSKRRCSCCVRSSRRFKSTLCIRIWWKRCDFWRLTSRIIRKSCEWRSKIVSSKNTRTLGRKDCKNSMTSGERSLMNLRKIGLRNWKRLRINIKRNWWNWIVGSKERLKSLKSSQFQNWKSIRTKRNWQPLMVELKKLRTTEKSSKILKSVSPFECKRWENCTFRNNNKSS